LKNDSAAEGFITLQERIERYLDACPPAVSGQHGHNRTFAVAIALIRGFDLSEAAALPFLRRYNERCQPKWSERELLHKLGGADNLRPKKGQTLKPRGYLL
jgi:putative DNA primase/helicase